MACEESQAVTKEFRRLGHEAYSCDIQECSGGHPEWHIQGDVLEALDEHYLCGCGYRFSYDLGKYGCPNCCGDKTGKLFSWDMMIAFPTCTYLTVTANKWFKDQPARKSGALVGAKRRAAREGAAEFFMALANAPIDKIAIENPVGIMSTRWKEPTQIICPSMFGHSEPKTTCLWLKNLHKIEHFAQDDLFNKKTHVEPEYHECASGKRMPKWYAYADKSKGQEERAKIRSKTFPGIAKAMAEQWG